MPQTITGTVVAKESKIIVSDAQIGVASLDAYLTIPALLSITRSVAKPALIPIIIIKIDIAHQIFIVLFFMLRA